METGVCACCCFSANIKRRLLSQWSALGQDLRREASCQAFLHGSRSWAKPQGVPAWTKQLTWASDTVCPKLSGRVLGDSMTQFTCETMIELVPLRGILQGRVFGETPPPQAAVRLGLGLCAGHCGRALCSVGSWAARLALPGPSRLGSARAWQRGCSGGRRAGAQLALLGLQKQPDQSFLCSAASETPCVKTK